MFDFGLYTQVGDLGPHGPLVYFGKEIWCWEELSSPDKDMTEDRRAELIPACI